MLVPPKPYQEVQAAQPFSGSGYVLPEYAYVRPPELNRVESNPRIAHPVVIVGAGLAGLTAACDLAVRGVRSIVIDEDNTVGVKGASSRGICYAQKSLEVFKRLGIYDRIVAKGVQWSVGRTLAGADVVYEFDLKDQAAFNLSEQPPFINIQQFYLEWFLVERIIELGLTDLRWRSRVIDVAQIEPGDEELVSQSIKPSVDLTIETPDGNYLIRAQWVLDGSGIRSPIRDALGLKTNPANGIDRWCISDVRFRHQAPIERWTWIEAPFNENRAVWQHLMADNVWRLDYQMDPNADLEYVSRPEVVSERLRRQFGEEVDFELIWVGPYTYRSHLLEKFRVGRILFMGDCAHVMSPFGARGGNSAIQDAENLAWKLALVLEGSAPDSLMDSYAEERKVGAEQNISITNRTSRFLSPRNAAERGLRDAAIGLARHFPFARTLVNTGRLSSPSLYPPKLNADWRWQGRSLQNVGLDDGTGDLSGLIAGNGFRVVLFCFDQADRDCAQQLTDARVVCVSLKNLSKLQQQLNLRAGELAVIRPDMYCVGVGPLNRLGEPLEIVFGTGQGIKS
jgi:3-(3-hydroxy-phenyl)propionate hydroxylase